MLTNGLNGTTEATATTATGTTATGTESGSGSGEPPGACSVVAPNLLVLGITRVVAGGHVRLNRWSGGRLGNRFRGGDATNFAIGQGDTIVTPLQLARAYAAFSNGGLRVQAHGINRIRTRSGKVLYQWREGSDGGRVSVVFEW